MRASLLLLSLSVAAACASTPPPAPEARDDSVPTEERYSARGTARGGRAEPIAPGQLLVRTAEREALTTATFRAASGRTDFIVERVECLDEKVCLVRVRREGAPADEAWTRGLIESLAGEHPPAILSVEPNRISRPF